MLTIYRLFCFTDFVPNAETRASFVGLSLVGMTYINMAVNLLPLMFIALLNVQHKLKYLYARIDKLRKK